MAIVEKPEILEQIILTISPAALVAIKQLLHERHVPDYALRILASGSGCSGVQFGLALESEAQHTDRVLEVEGIRILLDPVSLVHLNGVNIDYIENLTGKSFQITQSSATSGCGCGSSSQVVAHDTGAKASACCN